MTAATSIEWADSTFNPWIGCTKVSPACDHCYAERDMALRLKQVEWGPGKPRRRTSSANWRLPTRWNRADFRECGDCGWRGEVDTLISDQCPSCGRHERLEAARRRVFCASLADVFDNEVPASWRVDLFSLIRATPNLDWLLLTKRIGNAEGMIDEAGGWSGIGSQVECFPDECDDPYCDVGGCRRANESNGLRNPLPHVWLGITAANQAEFDRDWPKLRDTPARVRFVSVEPMLSPIDVSAAVWNFETCPNCPCPDPSASRVGLDQCCKDPALRESLLHWVIAGGESGPHARPSSIHWFRALRDQCAHAGVPFLFKQWGEWRPSGIYPAGAPGRFAFGDYEHAPGRMVEVDGYPRQFAMFGARAHMERVGKRRAGRLLDGREHNGFPSALGA